MNQHAIDNATMLRPDLYIIKNLFDSDVLNDLLAQLELETQWEHQFLQERLPRRTLRWVDDGLLDKVWCMLNDLDFSRFNFKFANVSIWKDLPGYCIKPHVDNDRVKAAMQIYLSDLPREFGTWFEEIEIPYVQNSGYIMNNQYQPWHGMKTPVPDGIVRYSLYARFNHV
jgi:hypothetical protein